MKTLPLPRFYRYMIYRLFAWRLRKNDDAPATTVTFILAFVHSAQLLSLLFIFVRVTNQVHFLSELPDLLLGGSYLIVSLLIYIVIYNESKWKEYIREFENESKSQRRSGTITLYSFTLGSTLLVLLLPPLLFYIL